MNDNNPPATWADRAVGVGAGLASALLFVVSSRGSSLAMALAYFSPLPMIIGGAGFSFPGALFGAAAGVALLAFAAQPPFALAFLFGFATPALVLAGLMQVRLRSRDPNPAAQRFVTPGEMLAAIVGLAILVAAFGVGSLLVHYHGFEPAMKAVMKHFAPALDEVVKGLAPVSDDFDAVAIKRLVIMSAPAGVAASQTLLLAANLWLAARTIEISGRLRRPWPDLPENVVLPRFVAPVFLIAAGLAFNGGFVAVFAGIVAAASGFGLALHGLAALHGLTRDVSLRSAWLAALYAAVVILEPWSVIVLAVFGLVESAFSLRARKARRMKTQG
ncbi:hypothetical protein K9U39_07965 [Rhodoblastus acidophilus]|uniref:DUF2232 domain-containing protein n=2 Tax=Candidatus Rhodoblastus alkanivorans TaxID=2954117 RepID=A0ABS9Z870_9HYPH|nr:hypothetical protein [Candidatus Rhodoblastus alkanivorans]MCI4683565.1 hypothetical protein [Candidatus Rhodoblastus alkanivorans]MDI4640880.1 hypothetical protein [Rhodoblastus acidophilus]